MRNTAEFRNWPLCFVWQTVKSARERIDKRRSDSERESVSERSQAKITSCFFFSPRSPARSRLLIYFEGLRLTRASTAGYFEMMQTLAAVCTT